MEMLINIHTEGNPSFPIMAEVIGQFAVHRRMWYGEKGWTVTHLGTGLAMTCWTHKHVAVNFAKRIDPLVDVGRILVDEDYKNQWMPYLKNLTKHPAYIFQTTNESKS